MTEYVWQSQKKKIWSQKKKTKKKREQDLKHKN